MKRLIFLCLLAGSFSASGQHCPWDCSGMILFKTDIPDTAFNKLNPVLVDENKNSITDTMYGTGLDTYDACRFLLYSDFKAYRTAKIKLHHWYQYDTLYNFANGYYVVKFNYCRFKRTGKSLYVRLNTSNVQQPEYHYIEVLPVNRIHLHDYSQLINHHDHEAILREIQPFILSITRDSLQ